MQSQGPEAKSTAASASSSGSVSGHLGGARADFVASLGRKVQDARVLLAAVEASPQSPAPRDELRRKLHALGVWA